ncbi:hypothetical protein B0O99DRAFT_644512 [Bisporella sp. PMI_857]|nr:hypothetical protein B0O99DRAFT_644512 [Bisporella sp. PMI_857]
MDTDQTAPLDSGQNLAEIPIRQPPLKRQLAQDELLELKPVIQRLYIDGGMTFEQVASHLTKKYNYCPTKRQFATLRRRWGMKKNTRIADRQRILDRLNTEKDISEEGLVGTVSLNIDKVRRWRKQLSAANSASQERHSHEGEDTTALPTALSQTTIITNSRTLRHLASNPKIPMRPSSPRTFQITERLLFNVESYMTGFIDNRIWHPPDNAFQDTRTQSLELSNSEDLHAFVGKCYSAKKLIDNQSFVEGRKLFSAACSLFRRIIDSRDPLTLRYTFYTLVILTRGGIVVLDEVIDMLRVYMGRMAALVLPANHPWKTIYHCLGILDRAQLEETLISCMECLSVVLGKKLGHLSRPSLTMRVEFIQARYNKNLEGGETSLRALLAECRQSAVAQKDLVQVLGELGINLKLQGRHLDTISIGEEIIALGRASGESIDLVNGLTMTAFAQYSIGDIAAAELNQREAAELCLSTPNLASFTTHLLATLESWLRDSGRAMDADALKIEINGMVAREGEDGEAADIEG